MSRGDGIRIREDELEKVVDAMGRGDRLIITSGGAFNSSFFVSIDLDKDKMDEVRELERYGQKYTEKPSEFARLLAGKSPQLGPGSRTKAQEEASREERRLKGR